MASSGLTLYSAGTPNGYKITILLEELGLTYEVRICDICGDKGPALCIHLCIDLSSCCTMIMDLYECIPNVLNLFVAGTQNIRIYC